jgi:hypothetical protein
VDERVINGSLVYLRKFCRRPGQGRDGGRGERAHLRKPGERMAQSFGHLHPDREGLVR